MIVKERLKYLTIFVCVLLFLLLLTMSYLTLFVVWTDLTAWYIWELAGEAKCWVAEKITDSSSTHRKYYLVVLTVKW